MSCNLLARLNKQLHGVDMSKIDFTPEAVSSLLNDSEQLSLALLMLFEQKLDCVTSKAVFVPLLEKLNNDLQEIQLLNRLQNQG